VGKAVQPPALHDTILLVDGVERRQVRERVCVAVHRVSYVLPLGRSW
jgi:hypothetical protein